MKLIKSLAIICVLVLSLVVLAGCGDGPGPDPVVSKTIEEVKADVFGVFDAYGNSDNGSFKLTATKGSEKSVVDMTYNYEGGKIGIISLKTVLTNATGELSCYVEDDQAYVNRYNQAKNIVKMTSKEGEEIASSYCFEVFAETLLVMLNDSFFKALTVESEENGVVKSSLGIGVYDISEEQESETLTTIFDGIKEKVEVTLEVTYANEAVSAIKVVLVGDVTSSIELQLLGTSESDIEIEFPSFDDYK